MQSADVTRGFMQFMRLETEGGKCLNLENEGNDSISAEFLCYRSESRLQS